MNTLRGRPNAAMQAVSMRLLASSIWNALDEVMNSLGRLASLLNGSINGYFDDARDPSLLLQFRRYGCYNSCA